MSSTINIECQMDSQCPQWNAYHDCVQTMLQLEFPRLANSSRDAIFEAVSREFIGTKQTRNGPVPSPEVLVSVRKVINDWMKAGEPIPVLIPWGGSKQGNGSVDIAEAMALKQIESLRARVEQHYAPGIETVIRLEDLTDNMIFADVPGWHDKTYRYCQELINLVSVVSPSTNVRLESSLFDNMTLKNLENHVQHLFDAFQVMDLWPDTEQHIEDMDVATSIELAGWLGEFPLQQFRYMRAIYRMYYPSLNDLQQLHMMATYYGMIIERRMQDASGFGMVSPITLYFGHQLPQSSAERRLYYRTVPERYQHTHFAPWLGKGLIKIVGDVATPAVTAWNGGGLQFTDHRVTLTNGTARATISAPYSVME